MKFTVKAALLAISSGLFIGCNEPPSSSPSAGSGIAFQFSKSMAVQNRLDEGNWCYKDFSEAVLINADAANNNRRYFLVGNGVLKVTVRLGNLASTFLLRRKDAKTVEVFTSDNFPTCLTNRANFALKESNGSLVFDNRKQINYTVSVQPATASDVAVFFEFPSEMNYGLTVHRCTECR